MKFWIFVFNPLERYMENYKEIFDAWEDGGVRGIVVGRMFFMGEDGGRVPAFPQDPKAYAALGLEPPEEAPRLCACYRPLLDGLAPEAAEVLRADLDGEPTNEVAARLGVSPGTLRVRRHRARAALRQRLDDVCRACAGCLDCSCDAPSTDSPVSLSPTPMHTPTDDTLRFGIEGMTCGGCVAAVTRALDRTPGVAVEHVGLNEPAVVRLSDGADREAVRGAVEGAGFRPVFDAA